MPLQDEWDALDAFLIGDGDEDQAALPTPLLLEGQNSADGALRRLARLEREQRDVRQVADAERARIDAWEADRLSGIDSRRRWVMDGLEGFMRAVNARSGTKTLNLPWGVLRLRARQPKVDLVDSTVPLPPAILHPPKPPSLDKTAAKAVLTVGEPIDRLAEPGWRYHAALNPEGEVVQGVAYLVPTEDGFTAQVDVPEGWT